MESTLILKFEELSLEDQACKLFLPSLSELTRIFQFGKKNGRRWKKKMIPRKEHN